MGTVFQIGGKPPRMKGDGLRKCEKAREDGVQEGDRVEESTLGQQVSPQDHVDQTRGSCRQATQVCGAEHRVL